MFQDAIGIVRPSWSFDLALVCQRFAGGVLDPEPEELIRAIETLGKSLPEPVTQLERVVLRDRLRSATDNAARQFHAQFHRLVSHECHEANRPVYQSLAWEDFDPSPHELLAQWATRYLQDFAKLHAWPPPMRAARIIRSSFESPLEVGRLARAVGCARSGLIRSFTDAYGVPMGDYQARCRVKSAFGRLRAADSNVGAIAFAVGYHSTKNFYRALRHLTGMTPSEVRGLSDERAEAISNTLLRLPAPTFNRFNGNRTRRRCRASTEPMFVAARRKEHDHHALVRTAARPL